MADKVTVIVEAILNNKKFKEALGKTETEAKKKTSTIGGFFSKLKSAILPVTLAIGAVTAAIVKAAKVGKEFEKAIAEVKAITGGTTEELEKLARMAGKTTVFSATEAAGALKTLALAGLDAKQSAKALVPTLNLATAASIGIGEATDIVVSQIKTFGLEMEDAENVVDQLAKTSQSSNTDIGELGFALKFAGATAKSVGASFEDTNAILGALADRGIKGTLAGTQLRAALSNLIKPTNAAKDTLEKYGISLEEVQRLLPTPIELFKRLSEANLTTADSLEIFGRRQSGIAALIKDGIPDLEKLRNKIGQAGGAAQKAADTQLDTLDGQLRLVKSAFEELVLIITKDKGFIDAMKTAATAIKGFIDLLAFQFNQEKDTLDAINKRIEALKGVEGKEKELNKLLIQKGKILVKNNQANISQTKKELKAGKDIIDNLDEQIAREEKKLKTALKKEKSESRGFIANIFASNKSKGIQEKINKLQAERIEFQVLQKENEAIILAFKQQSLGAEQKTTKAKKETLDITKEEKEEEERIAKLREQSRQNAEKWNETGQEITEWVGAAREGHEETAAKVRENIKATGGWQAAIVSIIEAIAEVGGLLADAGKQAFDFGNKLEEGGKKGGKAFRQMGRAAQAVGGFIEAGKDGLVGFINFFQAQAEKAQDIVKEGTASIEAEQARLLERQLQLELKRDLEAIDNEKTAALAKLDANSEYLALKRKQEQEAFDALSDEKKKEVLLEREFNDEVARIEKEAEEAFDRAKFERDKKAWIAQIKAQRSVALANANTIIGKNRREKAKDEIKDEFAPLISDINALQAFRNGGRVEGGAPIRVGEGGEEAFVPDQPGTIVPNDIISQMRFNSGANGGGVQNNSSVENNNNSTINNNFYGIQNISEARNELLRREGLRAF
jgi:TP901 family phage tail tape measure protein